MGRQHQGMNRPGVWQVPEGSGEQGKMEKTGCKIICGAPTTLAVKGLMMMMMCVCVCTSCMHAHTYVCVYGGMGVKGKSFRMFIEKGAVAALQYSVLVYKGSRLQQSVTGFFLLTQESVLQHGLDTAHV